MDSLQPDPRRRLALKLIDMETAFETTREHDSSLTDHPNRAYLDLETGEVIWPETDEDIQDCEFNDRFLRIPADQNRLKYEDLARFVETVSNPEFRRKLCDAIEGRGAFRRFKALVLGGGDIELRHAWNCFEHQRRRKRIIDWLKREGIEPIWDVDPTVLRRLPNHRPQLLHDVLEFVRRARQLVGVRRMALLGSLAEDKPHPKVVELLVEIDEDMDLGPLAKVKRRLQAKVLQTGDSRDTDVFLVTPEGRYLGRVCYWKECGPGIRMACDAQHCGAREFLHDDLQNFSLEPDVIARPPIELWPRPGACREGSALPSDVLQFLVDPLQGERAS